jgi:predicted Zn-dependent protease
MHGDGVAAGKELAGASVLDVAPTALAHLSIPISKELPGHVLDAAFASPLKAASVASYPPLPKREPPKTAASGDEEAVQKLAALGYLSGAAKRFAHDAEGRTPASFLNEGAARAAAGDDSGALRAFGKAIELDPSNVFALVYAARVYTARHELARATELLDRAEAARPNEVAVHIQRATTLLQAGDEDGAEAEISRGESIDDRLPVLLILKADLAQRRGKDADAYALLDRVATLTDADALLGQALAMQADIATRVGRPELAEALMRRASGLLPLSALDLVRGDLAMARRDPAAAVRFYRSAAGSRQNDAGIRRKLGKASAASGDLPGAETAFTEAVAVATDTDREGAYGDLATFYQFAEREADCLATLEKATRALPSSAALWAALGAAQGRASRPQEALASYERSVSISPTPLSLKTLAALVFELKKDRPRAVELWKRSLALQPAQPDVQAFLSRYSTKGG